MDTHLILCIGSEDLIIVYVVIFPFGVTAWVFAWNTILSILYTVLYCTVLYCTVLYGTVRYCSVLFCTVLIWFSPCLVYTYGYTVTHVRLFTANHKKPNLLTRQLLQEFHQSHTQLSWEWFNIVKYLSAVLLQTLLEAHRFLLKFMAVSCWLLLIPLSLWT